MHYIQAQEFINEESKRMKAHMFYSPETFYDACIAQLDDPHGYYPVSFEDFQEWWKENRGDDE